MGLIDFGMAVIAEPMTEFPSQLVSGTRQYLAPEVLRHRRYSTASDMWSTGIILFLLIQGDFPHPLKMYLQIQRVGNSDARELLLCILNKDPRLRMSADEASKHPWICGRSEHDNQVENKGSMHKATTAFLDFHKRDKLQKAVLTAVASQLCGQQLQHMRRHFQQLDSDGNGVVTEEELVALFEVNPPPSLEAPGRWVREIFDQLDSDGSGELEFTEFQAAVMHSYVGISQGELGRVIPATSKELMSYMEQFDRNSDGVLD